MISSGVSPFAMDHLCWPVIISIAVILPHGGFAIGILNTFGAGSLPEIYLISDDSGSLTNCISPTRVWDGTNNNAFSGSKALPSQFAPPRR